MTLVLMGDFVTNIATYFAPGIPLRHRHLLSLTCLTSRYHHSQCEWMVVVAAGLAPLCWLGTPADLWFVGVAALASTCAGCGLVLVQEVGTLQYFAVKENICCV